MQRKARSGLTAKALGKRREWYFDHNDHVEIVDYALPFYPNTPTGADIKALLDQALAELRTYRPRHPAPTDADLSVLAQDGEIIVRFEKSRQPFQEWHSQTRHR